jgi:PAS domain-containing protein
VGGSPEFATFLIARRIQIEAVMAARLGPAAPGPGAPEAEVLRRFRSFAASALRRGNEGAAPALDGLHGNERRTAAVLDSWAEAAALVAGAEGEALRVALNPLLQRFRTSLRQTSPQRRSRGAPRARRRAVIAAIDRVADIFLALEADSGRIVDANPAAGSLLGNPAAGSLLGVARDALLGIDAMSFVPEEQRGAWWSELDAMSEGTEPRRFASSLQDATGGRITVECSLTCFATRDRTLALVLARPR